MTSEQPKKRAAIRKILATPFVFVAAVIIILEDWLWDDLARLAAFIGQLPILRLKAAPLPAGIDQATAETTDDAPTPEQARRAAIVYGTPVVNPEGASTPSPVATRLPPAQAAADVEAEPDVEAFVPMEIPDIELRPEQTVVRIAQGTLAYDTARDMLRAFEAAANALVERYRLERADFDRGLLDAHTFASRLDTDELRWRGLSQGTLADRKYNDAALAGMRATLLAVVIHQRVFLSGYAAGLRAGDTARIDRAFEDLARADEALARARLYVN